MNKKNKPRFIHPFSQLGRGTNRVIRALRPSPDLIKSMIIKVKQVLLTVLISFHSLSLSNEVEKQLCPPSLFPPAYFNKKGCINRTKNAPHPNKAQRLHYSDFFSSAATQLRHSWSELWKCVIFYTVAHSWPRTSFTRRSVPSLLGAILPPALVPAGRGCLF